MKIIVKDDVFDVVNVLKNIDKDYFVIFDTDKKIYELHCENQGKETFCLSLPFDCLDQRTIEKTLMTRRQNKDKLFELIERENKKFEERRTYGS